mgnify:CR=1 FL=1
MIIGVITATAIVGGVGLFIGLFLGVAAIKFKVEVDEREEAVLNALPPQALQASLSTTATPFIT